MLLQLAQECVASGLFNHPICNVEQRNYTFARARCGAFNAMSVVEVVRLCMTSTRHLITGLARAEYNNFCVPENVAKLAEGRMTKAAIRTSRTYPVVVCTSLKSLLPHNDTSSVSVRTWHNTMELASRLSRTTTEYTMSFNQRAQHAF